MDSELSEEFEVNVAMHQGSVLTPFLYEVVIDVVSEFSRDVLNGLLYADDLAFLSEIKTIEGLRNMFRKWKDFESKGLKDNTK